MKHPVLIWCAGFIGAMLFFGIASNTSGPTWLQWYRLSERGQRVEGVITRVDPENHMTGYFTFAVGGTQYTGSDQGVHQQVGDRVTVWYLPDDPTFATLGGPLTSPAVDIVAGLVMSVGAGFVVLYSVRERERRRERQGPTQESPTPRG